MARGVGIPGVGVHQIGARHVLRDLQIDAESGECGVRVLELGGHQIRGDSGLVALRSERPDLHVEVTA